MNENPQVICFRCNKWFHLPQTLGTDPFPVQCTHCGYFHTTHDADWAFWPDFDEKLGKWIKQPNPPVLHLSRHRTNRNNERLADKQQTK